jgi:hypothetical protein
MPCPLPMPILPLLRCASTSHFKRSIFTKISYISIVPRLPTHVINHILTGAQVSAHTAWCGQHDPIDNDSVYNAIAIIASGWLRRDGRNGCPWLHKGIPKEQIRQQWTRTPRHQTNMPWVSERTGVCHSAGLAPCLAERLDVVGNSGTWTGPDSRLCTRVRQCQSRVLWNKGQFDATQASIRHLFQDSGGHVHSDGRGIGGHLLHMRCQARHSVTHVKSQHHLARKSVNRPAIYAIVARQRVQPSVGAAGGGARSSRR